AAHLSPRYGLALPRYPRYRASGVACHNHMLAGATVTHLALLIRRYAEETSSVLRRLRRKHGGDAGVLWHHDFRAQQDRRQTLAMIGRILELSLRNPALVLFGALLLLAFGLWSARDLPIDAVPDITSPQIQVNTEVPALAPEEAEKLVTYPIETELAGLPGAADMRSLTKSGLSQVTLEFEDNVDIFRVRQLAMERLQNAKDRLPAGAEPKLAPISTGLGEIFYYAVDSRPGATNKPESRYAELLELSDIQEYVIKPQLRSVPGVAEVNVSGGYERQIVVQPDPGKLRDANVTFSELAEVIAANTANTGGGFVNQANKQLIIRGLTRVQTVEDIANLPVKFTGAV